LTGGTVTVRASQGQRELPGGDAVDRSSRRQERRRSRLPLGESDVRSGAVTLVASASSGWGELQRVSGPATVREHADVDGVGTVTVRASQGATGTTWRDAGGPQLHVGKGAQTITFAALGSQTYGAGPVTLEASASSGLAVSFSVVAGPATVAGSTLTLAGRDGDVRASQGRRELTRRPRRWTGASRWARERRRSRLPRWESDVRSGAGDVGGERVVGLG